MERDDERDTSERSGAPGSDASREPNPYLVEQTEPDDFNPFWSVWTRPRETVRRIVAEDPERHVVLLTCLAGIAESFDRASGRGSAGEIPLALFVVMACVLGPLGGLFSLWLGSHTITISGNWIGGQGIREHIRSAIAWAYVPTAFSLVLWVPLIALLGSDLFSEDMPGLEAQPWLAIPSLAIMFVQLVLGLWALVLLCNTIGEVQGYRSAWRGFGNVLLAGLLVAVPLIAVVFVMVSLTGL